MLIFKQKKFAKQLAHIVGTLNKITQTANQQETLNMAFINTEAPLYDSTQFEPTASGVSHSKFHVYLLSNRI